MTTARGASEATFRGFGKVDIARCAMRVCFGSLGSLHLVQLRPMGLELVQKFRD